ncbi:MAG: hypothetical protein P4M08_06545 [Oligoflexia bacterium]|nr:hypothetical protein [Oligoflexia bacterium]
MKNNLLLTLTFTSLVASSAHAAAVINAQEIQRLKQQSSSANASPLSQGVHSPYQACRNVLIVNKDAADQIKESKIKLPGGCDQVEEMPETGMFSHLSQATGALDLTQLVAKKYLDNVKQNESVLNAYLKCFPQSSGCDAKMRAELQGNIAQGAPALRTQLALAQSQPGANAINRAGMVSSKVSDHLNVGGAALGDLSSMLGIQNAIGSSLAGQSLSSAELAQATKTMTQESQAAAGSTGSSKRKLMNPQLWQKINDAHRAQFQALLYGKYRIFATLGKPTWNNGVPTWTDAQIHDGLQKLLENAQNEEKITQHAIAKSDVEFGNAQQLFHNFMGGNRDLMSYMAVQPVVEQVLKEHPDLCGMATGVEKYVDAENTRENLGAGAVMIAAGFTGVGLIGDAAVGSVAIAGAATLGMGLGATTYYMGNAVQNYNQVKQQALTSTGANSKDATLVDPAKIASARQALDTNIALAPTMFIGGGGAGGAVTADSEAFIAAKNAFAKAAVAEATAETKPELAAALASAHSTNDIIEAVKQTKGLAPEQSAHLTAALKEVQPEAEQIVHDNDTAILHAVGGNPAELAKRPDLQGLSHNPDIVKLEYSAEHDPVHPIPPSQVEAKFEQALNSCGVAK